MNKYGNVDGNATLSDAEVKALLGSDYKNPEEGITGKIVIDALNAFWDWIDDRAIIRRISFGITVYMTYESFRWATEFATTTDKTGAEVGLIIAAVTAPIAALQAFVTSSYTQSRDK